MHGSKSEQCAEERLSQKKISHFVATIVCEGKSLGNRWLFALSVFAFLENARDESCSKREWEDVSVEVLSQFVTSEFEVRQEFELSWCANKKSDRPCRSIASHLFPAFGVAGPDRRGHMMFL